MEQKEEDQQETFLPNKKKDPSLFWTLVYREAPCPGASRRPKMTCCVHRGHFPPPTTLPFPTWTDKADGICCLYSHAHVSAQRDAGDEAAGKRAFERKESTRNNSRTLFAPARSSRIAPFPPLVPFADVKLSYPTLGHPILPGDTGTGPHNPPRPHTVLGRDRAVRRHPPKKDLPTRLRVARARYPRNFRRKQLLRLTAFQKGWEIRPDRQHGRRDVARMPLPRQDPPVRQG